MTQTTESLHGCNFCVLAGQPISNRLDQRARLAYTPPVARTGRLDNISTPRSAAPVAGGRIRQRRSDMKLHELRDN
ncbi:MAG: hypothetical protein KDK24_13725, partial [Pseudooceanicola sp.]|nr:hypothetical protein [Pseudooceanicola sp.]